MQKINSLLTKSTIQLKGLKIFTTRSKNFSPTTKTIPFSITYRFFTFSSVPFSHEPFSAVCKIFSDGCVTLRVEGEAKIVGKFGRESENCLREKCRTVWEWNATTCRQSERLVSEWLSWLIVMGS